MQESPIAVVQAFSAAMARGDLESALAHYEENAVFFSQPNEVLVGKARIREALAALIALGAKIRTVHEAVRENEGIALYQSEWCMEGRAPDGSIISLGGRSADVLRQARDGAWRIAIDNPWGERALPELERGDA